VSSRAARKRDKKKNRVVKGDSLLNKTEGKKQKKAGIGIRLYQMTSGQAAAGCNRKGDGEGRLQKKGSRVDLSKRKILSKQHQNLKGRKRDRRGGPKKAKKGTALVNSKKRKLKKKIDH